MSFINTSHVLNNVVHHDASQSDRRGTIRWLEILANGLVTDRSSFSVESISDLQLNHSGSVLAVQTNDGMTICFALNDSRLYCSYGTRAAYILNQRKLCVYDIQDECGSRKIYDFDLDPNIIAIGSGYVAAGWDNSMFLFHEDISTCTLVCEPLPFQSPIKVSCAMYGYHNPKFPQNATDGSHKLPPGFMLE